MNLTAGLSVPMLVEEPRELRELLSGLELPRYASLDQLK